jgi:hypothetical protein
MDRFGNPSHGTVIDYDPDADDPEAATSADTVTATTESEIVPPAGQRFGTMFDLEPADHGEEFLRELGAKGGPMDESEVGYEVGESSLPAGNPFLGQYLDHDITLDVRSSLDRRADPRNLRNFRTPRLDLDSVYGAGREVDNYLYHRGGMDAPPGEGAKLLVGVDEDGTETDDVQRNREGFAVIGDPRNDENTIISQLQLAFVRFHNRVVDALLESDEELRGTELLERAQELVRRHYQWVIVNQFLPRICEQSVLNDVLENGGEFFAPTEPGEVYIPVEFAGAAYRYGHSQIRTEYTVNDDARNQPFYGPPSRALGFGFRPVDQDKTVEWEYFFETEGEETVQRSRKIDPLVSPILLDLPFISDDEETSLAARNLLRGRSLELPSGQAVARELGVEPLTNEDLGLASFVESQHGEADAVEAPLWYYILAEARIEHDGDRLGPVGSRVVAETVVGLLDADPTSYRRQADWKPELVSPETDTPAEEFRIDDIVADGPLRLGSKLSRTLIIEGTGPYNEYSIAVSEELSQVDGELEGIDVSIDGHDRITGSEAEGAISGGADGFRFSGEITEFLVNDPEEVNVYIDGKRRQIRPTLPRTLVIDSTGPSTEYSFTVSGGLEQVAGDLEGISVSENQDDVIEGSMATATVGGGADGFRFEGEIESFSVDDPDSITVYVDGEQHDPNSVAVDVTAAFDANPPSPAPNEAVTFDGGASEASGGSIDSYEWELTSSDAGTTVETETGLLFSTRIESSGTYNVRLTVATDDERTATESKRVEVTPKPGEPRADIDGTDRTVLAGREETFSDTSTDPDGEIVDRFWTVSRGRESIAAGTGETFTHAFEDAGEYTVELQVNDDDGRQDTASVNVTAIGTGGL